MKICFITPGFGETLFPFVQHLHKKGHNCSVNILSLQGTKDCGTLTFDDVVNGCSIKTVSLNNDIYSYLDKSIPINVIPYYLEKNKKLLIGLLPYFFNRSLVKRFVKKIKEGNYDIIYVVVHEYIDAFVCQQLKTYGLTNVFIAYHEIVKDHLMDQTLRGPVKQTIDLGFRILTFSDFSRNQLVHKGNVQDVQTVYFGPFETFCSFETQQPLVDESYILFIGSILPYKGLSFLVDTIKKHGIPQNVKIVVAGSGYDPCLAEIADDDRYIVINRYLKDDVFANLVRYATCVVCPYVKGSQSGITHTAMVFGTPIVATKVGAFPEFVEDGKNGYLVEYGNKEQLWKAINKVMTSQSKNWSYIPKHLCWENIVDQFVASVNDDCFSLDA